MRVVRHIALLVLVILVSRVGKGQDEHFSQMEQAPLLMNPANTGLTEADQRASLHFRTQWGSVVNPYKTTAFMIDTKLAKKKIKPNVLAIGLMFYRDRSGDLNLSSSLATASVAYHAKVDANSTLGAAISAGYMQKYVDLTNGQWDNQFDGTGFNPALHSREQAAQGTMSSFDLAAGFVYNYRVEELKLLSSDVTGFTFGGAIHHATRPVSSLYTSTDYRKFWRITGQASGFLGFGSSNMGLKPGVYYMKEGPHTNVLFGTYIKAGLSPQSYYTGFIKSSAFWFGGHYRWNDAFIISAMLEMAGWMLGVSYDATTSQLNTTSGTGGFEISLRFINPNPNAGRVISGKVGPPRDRNKASGTKW